MAGESGCREVALIMVLKAKRLGSRMWSNRRRASARRLKEAQDERILTKAKERVEEGRLEVRRRAWMGRRCTL